MSLYDDLLVHDEALREEIAKRFPAIAESAPATPKTGSPFAVRGQKESLPANPPVTASATLADFTRAARGSREAIIRQVGRPSLLISNDSIEMPLADTWRMRITPHLTAQETLIRSVGRVEVATDWGESFWLGTCWMVAPEIAVTNRHVAEEFLQNRPQGAIGPEKNLIVEGVTVTVDFREEYTGTEPLTAEVESVLFAGHPLQDPDIAFLKLRRPAARPLPPPIPLFVGDLAELLTPEKLDFRRPMAVIGYPGKDDVNDPNLMRSIFGTTFEVKRYAPGFCTKRVERGEAWVELEHDCTTLKGSSGSVVADIRSGCAVALHYQGLRLVGNDAVAAATVKRYLDQVLGEAVSVPVRETFVSLPTEPTKEAARKKDPDGPFASEESLKGRVGYVADFLGKEEHLVPLPDFSAFDSDTALLPYTNFTVAMSKARRLARFTAVNIDGTSIQRIKRKSENWTRDPRIPAECQAGATLYLDNDYDRGHLVRRLDPAWGDSHHLAEADTFFYTNAAPQHKNLNRKVWLGLEDYLLNHADLEGFRACVFTGPVFRDTDQKYSDIAVSETDQKNPDIAIPEEFWKVAVMVNAETKKLHATGYLLSQRHLLRKTEVFGQYLTSQRPLRHIERLTGLSFGALKDVDPLEKSGPKSESIRDSGESVRLDDFEDIRL